MKTFKRKTLSFEGKGKLLIASGIIFLSPKMLISPCARALGSKKNCAQTFWSCVKEQVSKALGDELRCDAPRSSPGISRAWWPWQMATHRRFPKASFKYAQDFPFNLAVCCHSYMKRKVWQEQNSEYFQQGSSKSPCVTGQPFNPPGNIPETQLE